MRRLNKPMIEMCSSDTSLCDFARFMSAKTHFLRFVCIIVTVQTCLNCYPAGLNLEGVVRLW